MRIKIKFLLLLPTLTSLVSCSSSDKITFKCGNDTFTTYYNDDYFNLNNDEMHSEIALASHAMALATFNGNDDYSKRSEDLIDLWHKEGFSNLYFNEAYTTKPGTDTIGYGIASKDIQIFGGKYTLIAIAVRGGNYEAEWTSNITIGGYGNATGFDQASDLVIEGIKSYIPTYKINGHIKIWISGFSRAAITSNMVAGKILNKLNEKEMIAANVQYDKRDIYAYCFEPPMGVEANVNEANDTLYQGIHNFINYNDLVPLVAPSEWGFARYGTDHYYPDRLTDIYFDYSEREKLISQYHFTPGAQNFPRYTVDEWKFFNVHGEHAEENNLPVESIHPSQGRFSRALIHELAVTGFENRGYYAMLLEKGLRELMATVMGANEKIKGIDTSHMIDIIFEYAFIKNLINELENNQAAEFGLDIQMLFYQLFGANEDNFEEISTLYSTNFFFFASLADGLKYRQDISAQLLYRDNAMNIIIGHMPQLSYSFLSSCDTRLHKDKACKFNDGTYQILHINEPDNFTLFEKNIQKDVFLYQDDKMSSDYLAAEKFFDGSISIYLPNNGDYEYIGGVKDVELFKVDAYGNESDVSASINLAGTNVTIK